MASFLSVLCAFISATVCDHNVSAEDIVVRMFDADCLVLASGLVMALSVDRSPPDNSDWKVESVDEYELTMDSDPASCDTVLSTKLVTVLTAPPPPPPPQFCSINPIADVSNNFLRLFLRAMEYPHQISTQ